jgi:hypothetical protein
VLLGLMLVKRSRGRQPNVRADVAAVVDGSMPDRPWSARAAKAARQQPLRTTADQQHHMVLNSSRNARNDCRTAVATASNDCCSTTVETAAPS